jgi:hypothetical protein
MFELKEIRFISKPATARTTFVQSSPKKASKPTKTEAALLARIEKIAVGVFKSVLAGSANHQAPFKALVTIQVDDAHKPLLLVGTAHSAVEDGSVIAVLNPDQELVNKLNGGWGCNSAIFREAVAKKCDLALNIWVDAYKPDGVCLITKYMAREPRPAKFSVARANFPNDFDATPWSWSAPAKTGDETPSDNGFQAQCRYPRTVSLLR